MQAETTKRTARKAARRAARAMFTAVERNLRKAEERVLFDAYYACADEGASVTSDPDVRQFLEVVSCA